MQYRSQQNWTERGQSKGEVPVTLIYFSHLKGTGSVIHMCRTGLKEEENIKKARGQALINFRRLAQVISKTSLGSLCFQSFAFVCSFFPPLSPHSLPSQSQPLSPGQQQDKLLPLLKPGSQPVGTQRRCRGLLALSPRRPHVSRQGRVCSRDRGAQGWSAARSPQPPRQKPIARCHPTAFSTAGKASTRLLRLREFSSHHSWFQAAEESLRSNYSKSLLL